MKTAFSLESQLDSAGPGASQNMIFSMFFEVLVLGVFLGPLFFEFYRFLARFGVPLGPHFGTFLVMFRDFMLFGGCFLGVLVFEPFGDSIFTVLGIIFECFFDVFWVVFSLKRGSQKCGLDTLFTVYKAHGHF